MHLNHWFHPQLGFLIVSIKDGVFFYIFSPFNSPFCLSTRAEFTPTPPSGENRDLYGFQDRLEVFSKRSCTFCRARGGRKLRIIGPLMLKVHFEGAWQVECRQDRKKRGGGVMNKMDGTIVSFCWVLLPLEGMQRNYRASIICLSICKIGVYVDKNPRLAFRPAASTTRCSITRLSGLMETVKVSYPRTCVWLEPDEARLIFSKHQRAVL